MRLVAVLLLALAVGCGSTPETQSSAAIDESQGSEGQPRGPGERGWHHFWIIHQARDAVIDGNVTMTRHLLARIADGDLGEDVPADWQVWIDEMQDEASRTERMRQWHELAEIVTAIASRCGDCHRSISGRPRTIPLAELEQRVHGVANLVPAAANHRWAADELWIGLTTPVYRAWVRGSRALIDSPLHAPPPPAQDDGAADPEDNQAPDAPTLEVTPLAPAKASIDPKLSKELQALAQVGESLNAEGKPLPMARAYANLISRCASCHRRLKSLSGVGAR